MFYFVSGPVDMEFADGILDNWHLEVYNNTNATVPVTLKVYDVNCKGTIFIGGTSRDVDAYTHQYLTLSTNGVHHTIAQIQYPQDTGEILVTLYGRDQAGLALPGAIYFANQLTALQNGIGQ